MKLCKDCKYFQPHPDSHTEENGLCAVSRVTENPVTGLPRLHFAINERDSAHADACGPEGKRFGSKDSA